MDVKQDAREAAGPQTNPLKRRGLLWGAGAVGAAALAVKALPLSAPAATALPVAAKPLDEAGAGYRVTPHVRRYYETAA